MWVAIQQQWHVLVALLLRDIRSRFFYSAFGYILVILWPLSHILILVGIHSLTNRAIPYGDSASVWFATGVVPFMAFNYMSRNIGLGPVLNRTLLIFPAIKIMDMVTSRVVMEVLNTVTVIISVIVVLELFQIDPFPPNPGEAIFALLSCMLLGVGVGILNAVIALLFPFWVTGYALLLLILWMSSGVFFVPDALPETVRYYLSFNPALQGVEWMRAAYYEGYGGDILDRAYMIKFSIATLLLGLLMERVLRVNLLKG